MGAFLQKALNGILSRIASSLSLSRLNKPLTELFLELKTATNSAIVERIVNDIDEIVRVIRFEG